MGGFIGLLVVYVIGGLTFIPLILCAVLLHAWLTFPHVNSLPETFTDSRDELREDTDDGKNIVSGNEAIARTFQGDHEKDVAEGYFAVCREYVPGGVNGKPPVRTTPAGSAVAEESPSVYQSMYRSLFERRQVSSLDPTKSDSGKSVKRARNVFYVVLRHGHLMLYDDSEQVEVRHVISLAHHDVSIYGGGNEIPEGELWIKRNAISLRRRVATPDQGSITLPFFFFSENCSEKEDFYFALLRSQHLTSSESSLLPQIQHFEVKDIISLVQRLHSSEEHLQTRWLNALVGRLFLALYKTQTAEDFLHMKITKKIARVRKPNFLSGIILNKISLGTSAPFITNPKLRGLTVEGEYCAETNVKYEGNFRIEIAATARIDLGPRFKAREVNLVLAVVVKKLEGRLLIRLKPPPTNRIWIAFEAMPQLELSIEPIVSSRQITYSIILRAIESRIREVLAETIVLPHWDDSPFLDTTQELFRGGIWANERTTSRYDHGTAIPDEVAEDDTDTGSLKDSSPTLKPLLQDCSASMPSLIESMPEAGTPRRGHKLSSSLVESNQVSVSSGIQKTPEVPKVMRSKSFAAVADPVVNTSSVNSDANKTNDRIPRPTKDAASFMTEISNRSQPSSPVSTPATLASSGPIEIDRRERKSDPSSASSLKESVLDDRIASHNDRQAQDQWPVNGSGHVASNSNNNRAVSSTQQTTRFQAMAKSLTPSEKRQQALLSAANTAKNWGWNTLNRRGKSPASNTNGERAGTPEYPMGRGRPLPPPGQPLPLPEKRTSLASLPLPKRKPVLSAAISSPQHRGKVPLLSLQSPGEQHRPASLASTEQGADALLVVEAPNELGSRVSPEEDPDGYGEFMDNVKLEDDDQDSHMVGQTMTPYSEGFESPKRGQRASAIGGPASSSLSSSYEKEDTHGLAS